MRKPTFSRHVVTVLVMIAVFSGLTYALWTGQLRVEPMPSDGGIPFITKGEITNPTIGPKYGFRGYIEVTFDPTTPKSLNLSRGAVNNFTLNLRLVPHLANLTEAEVTLNPSMGVMLEVNYWTGSGTASFRVNDLISYSLKGRMTIRAGQPLSLTMTLRIPSNIPEKIPKIKFILQPLGISGSIHVPVILGGMIDVEI